MSEKQNSFTGVPKKDKDDWTPSFPAQMPLTKKNIRDIYKENKISAADRRELATKNYLAVIDGFVEVKKVDYDKEDLEEAISDIATGKQKAIDVIRKYGIH